MAKYRVILKPIEHFFFGVEKVGNLGNRKTYYLETAEFPQQTSILGLLRYMILMKNEKLEGNISSDKSIIDLIGSESFPGNPITGYGLINEISPVFIYNIKSQIAYFPRPLDWEYHYSEKRDEGRVCYGIKEEPIDLIPYLDGYDAKKEEEQFLISSKGESIPLWYDKEKNQGILRKQVKAGTQKNPERFIPDSAEDKKSEARNEAYYKQEFLYMDHKYSYACIADIEDEGLGSYKTVLPFGGERSSFAVSFELLDNAESLNECYLNLQPQNDCLKIELLSDSYLNQDILRLTCFAICGTSGFRNLRTKTTTENHSRISEIEADNCAQFSSRLQLLKRGSVLFFDSIEQLQEAEKMFINEAFTKIGYNKYRKFEIKNK